MTATSYVETVHGAEFSIVLKLERNFKPRGSPMRRDERLVCAISLDGQAVTSHLLNEKQLKNGITYGMDNARDHVDGVACYRKLTFAQHKTTEGKPDPSLIHKLSKIGEVQLALWVGRETGTFARSESKFKALGEDGIPEKALKGRAVSNHATLGRVDRISSAQGRAHKTYSYDRGPFATYKFKHRSRRDLEIEGIIKSRPLLPLEQQDPEDLTPEEARELVRRMRATKEKDTPVKIKPEVKFKPEKSGKRQHSDVVDIEDGDDEEVSITSVVALNTKRMNTAGSSSVEVLDLTGE